jgi:hypothetical protein
VSSDNTYDPETGEWTTDDGRYRAFVDSRPEYQQCDDALGMIFDPEQNWPYLLELIAEVDDDLLEYAGAGPLETLVKRHAAAFIDRIEARAKADPRFRACLATIWLTDGKVPPDIQQRLLDATGGQIRVFPRDDQA